MSQLRSPIRKYSIFSESSFPIKVSKGEKIPDSRSSFSRSLFSRSLFSRSSFSRSSFSRS